MSLSTNNFNTRVPGVFSENEAADALLRMFQGNGTQSLVSKKTQEVADGVLSQASNSCLPDLHCDESLSIKKTKSTNIRVREMSIESQRSVRETVFNRFLNHPFPSKPVLFRRPFLIFENLRESLPKDKKVTSLIYTITSNDGASAELSLEYRTKK